MWRHAPWGSVVKGAVTGTIALIVLFGAIDDANTVEPQLTVNSPAETSTVSNSDSTFTVKGQVEPPEAEIRVNGENVTTNSDGAFDTVIDLQEGENEIKITAINGSKQDEYVRVVTRKPGKQAAAKEGLESDSQPEPKSEPEPKPKPEPEPESEEPNFSDGTHQVGTDIQPGTYRTREGSPGCYYARLAGFSNELDDILANGNASGPAIVTIEPTDAGFESQGCGIWTQDLSAITESKTSFGEGAYIVGKDIEPGTYKNSGSSGCYYARLSGFTGDMNNIIANGNTEASTVVTIEQTDAGFESQGCGTWTKIE